jgi:hypothetical protein
MPINDVPVCREPSCFSATPGSRNKPRATFGSHRPLQTYVFVVSFKTLFQRTVTAVRVVIGADTSTGKWTATGFTLFVLEWLNKTRRTSVRPWQHTALLPSTRRSAAQPIKMPAQCSVFPHFYMARQSFSPLWHEFRCFRSREFCSFLLMDPHVTHQRFI